MPTTSKAYQFLLDHGIDVTRLGAKGYWSLFNRAVDNLGIDFVVLLTKKVVGDSQQRFQEVTRALSKVCTSFGLNLHPRSSALLDEGELQERGLQMASLLLELGADPLKIKNSVVYPRIVQDPLEEILASHGLILRRFRTPHTALEAAMKQANPMLLRLLLRHVNCVPTATWLFFAKTLDGFHAEDHPEKAQVLMDVLQGQPELSHPRVGSLDSSQRKSDLLLGPETPNYCLCPSASLVSKLGSQIESMYSRLQLVAAFEERDHEAVLKLLRRGVSADFIAVDKLVKLLRPSQVEPSTAMALMDCIWPYLLKDPAIGLVAACFFRDICKVNTLLQTVDPNFYLEDDDADWGDSDLEESGISPLIAAVASTSEADSIAIASAPLQAGAKSTSHDHSGGGNVVCPLLFALKQGYYKIVAFLTENGFDINACVRKGWECNLREEDAFDYQDDEAVGALLKLGLNFASQWYLKEFLLGERWHWIDHIFGPDPDLSTFVHSACHLDVLKADLAHAKANGTRVWKILAQFAPAQDEHRYMPDCGGTLLQYASREGDIGLVHRLIRFGKDVNACPSRYESTALQYAVQCGWLDIIHTLIQNGADVNARIRSQGPTTLQDAVRYAGLEIVHILIQNGADVNAPPGESASIWFNRTALEGAAELGYIDIVQLLVEHGAWILGRDGEGSEQYHRALEFARKNGKIAARDYLKRVHGQQLAALQSQ